MKTPNEVLIRQLDAAMLRRDARAAYAVSAKIDASMHPGKPPNIARIKHVTRVYAEQLHGWRMPNA